MNERSLLHIKQNKFNAIYCERVKCGVKNQQKCSIILLWSNLKKRNACFYFCCKGVNLWQHFASAWSGSVPLRQQPIMPRNPIRWKVWTWSAAISLTRRDALNNLIIRLAHCIRTWLHSALRWVLQKYTFLSHKLAIISGTLSERRSTGPLFAVWARIDYQHFQLKKIMCVGNYYALCLRLYLWLCRKKSMAERERFMIYTRSGKITIRMYDWKQRKKTRRASPVQRRNVMITSGSNEFNGLAYTKHMNIPIIALCFESNWTFWITNRWEKARIEMRINSIHLGLI